MEQRTTLPEYKNENIFGCEKIARQVLNISGGIVEFSYGGVKFSINENSFTPNIAKIYGDCLVMGWDKIGPDYSYSSDVAMELKAAHDLRKAKEVEERRQSNLRINKKEYAEEMYELLSDIAEEMRFAAHPHFDPRVQRINELISRINSNT